MSRIGWHSCIVKERAFAVSILNKTEPCPAEKYRAAIVGLKPLDGLHTTIDG